MAEFDRLAEVYDESVSSFGMQEVEAIVETLRYHECQSVLEIGVGTGLVLKPLQDQLFETVGIDVSMPMILKAKSKGLENLIVADARCLPLRKKIFDAAILVDVLNCLENPITVFSQIEIVTRKRIIAIKRKYERETEHSEIYDPKFARLRERVQRFTSYTVNDFPKRWEKEDKVIRLFPALQSVVVSDRIIETSAESMITRLERGAFRFTSNIPENELKEIANELRVEMSGSHFRRRRIREMVVWDANLSFSNSDEE
jgi:ubiquinone/menaquinone biosynthesis C-methylase UbiE